MPGTRTLAVAAACATLVALATLPAVAVGSASRASSSSTTYPDSIGEDPQAPDITSTTVSNDDAGLITFRVAISNRPSLTPDMLLEIDMDTDANPATGDSRGLVAGTDFLIQLVPGAVNLYKWSGSDYPGVAAPSLVYAYDASGATIKVNAADLGNARTINFLVAIVSGATTDADGNPDFTSAHLDFSPDPGHGAFTYEVKVTVSLSATAFTTSPKPPRAGRPFSVGLAASESDTGGPVQQGTVRCVGRIGGRLLRPRSSRVVNGVAVCMWAIPKTAKGKRIAGSITLTSQGATLTRSFSQKIA